jgi:hypothetical protein
MIHNECNPQAKSQISSTKLQNRLHLRTIAVTSTESEIAVRRHNDGADVSAGDNIFKSFPNSFGYWKQSKDFRLIATTFLSLIRRFSIRGTDNASSSSSSNHLESNLPNDFNPALLGRPLYETTTSLIYIRRKFPENCPR